MNKLSISQDLVNAVSGKKSFMEELVEQLSDQNEEFEVTMPTGHKFKFKRPLDYADFQALTKRSAKFANTKSKGNPNPELQKYFDTTPEVKGMAATMAELIIEPKLSLVEFLKLAKLNAFAFNFLVNSFEEGMTGNLTKQYTEAIEAGKGELEETLPGETS